MWLSTPNTRTNAPLERNENSVKPRKPGVLLVNVGTPDAPDAPAVRRYLAEFLADPLVIRLPRGMRWLQRPLARFIASRRAPHSAEKYQQIWTERGSPLRAIMEDQVAALNSALPKDWEVFYAMRYGRPTIAETLRDIAARGVDDLTVVPLYPQFSQTTTGTVLQELYRALKLAGLHINVTARTTWYDDAGYLNAQAHLVAEYAAAHGLTPDNSVLIFSAHGLPVSYVQAGDPYARQIAASVDLVARRLGWPDDRLQLAYQSRMGPSEWLKPDLTTVLTELASGGEKRALVCPVSFAVDCLETLEEIDIRAREDFAALGGDLFVCPALNSDARFVGALKNLVVRGPRPVTSWSRAQTPLIQPRPQRERPRDAGLDSLVMIGVSLPGRIGPGRGPELRYTDAGALACAKKTHSEVQALLSDLKHDERVQEAFVWNTCHRFECYAWLRPGSSQSERGCVVTAMRNRVVAAETPQMNVNVLFGSNAWHHLMRTISGLNSGLPGDKDIVEQFHTAFQTAQRVGTAGPRAESLVDEAVTLCARVRAETAWGGFDPGYGFAVLSRIHEQLPLRLPNCRHVVVGGSSTSRSLLQTLYQQFDVKERSVTLVYRSHQGGQMKELRKAVGHGHRLRTDSYSDRAVLAAIADADLVYFGIDRDEPVLTREMLEGLRDFEERPLTILDFNSSGSTSGLAQVAGVRVISAAQLDREVRAFADTMCAQENFPRIVRQAEAWIEDNAPSWVSPNLELPCQSNGSANRLQCHRCGRVLEPASATRVEA